MYTKTNVMTARSVLTGAAALASVLVARNVAAEDHIVTVSIHVSTQGLDLHQPDGAKVLLAPSACSADSLHARQPGRPGAIFRNRNRRSQCR